MMTNDPKPSEAPADAARKNRPDAVDLLRAIENRLAAVEKILGEPRAPARAAEKTAGAASPGPTAPAFAKPPEPALAALWGRPAVRTLIGAVIASLLLLTLAAGLVAVLARSVWLDGEMRSTQRADEAVASLADAQATNLKAGEDRLNELAERVKKMDAELDASMKQHQKMLGDLEARGKALDQTTGDARAKVKEIDASIERVGSNLAVKIDEFLQKNHKAPTAELRLKLDHIAQAVENLRDAKKRPIEPERAALVVFNSSRLKDQLGQVKGAVEGVMRGPYRANFEGYQMALFLASNGAIPTGKATVDYGTKDPIKELQNPWTNDPNSTENVAGLDPLKLFPDDWKGSRRIVLVVSALEGPPKTGDPRWNGRRVSALLIGEPGEQVLKDWGDFSKSGGGAARVIPIDGKLSDSIRAALDEELRPKELAR